MSDRATTRRDVLRTAAAAGTLSLAALAGCGTTGEGGEGGEDGEGEEDAVGDQGAEGQAGADENTEAAGGTGVGENESTDTDEGDVAGARIGAPAE